MIASIAPKEKVGLGHMLEVEQQMPGPLEQIYAAWTSATEMARWWWPHIADARYRIDPRPGGSYRMESEAAGIAVEGEYVSLDPPREIVMTWRWLSDGVGDVEETVRIEFRPNDEAPRSQSSMNSTKSPETVTASVWAGRTSSPASLACSPDSR